VFITTILAVMFACELMVFSYVDTVLVSTVFLWDRLSTQPWLVLSIYFVWDEINKTTLTNSREMAFKPKSLLVSLFVDQNADPW